MTKPLAQPTTPDAANHAFGQAHLEFKQLLGKFQALDDANFGAVDRQDRNWGEVGSLNHINHLLKQALEHYGIYG